MKKTSKRFFVLAILMVASVCSYAQGLTATLQQGGKMTPYYGVDAFKEAYAAASNGAVITLSAGTFNTVDRITKQITVIGNGAIGNNKTILQQYNHSTEGWVQLIINANNVTIEGISKKFSDDRIIISGVSNTKIRYCDIAEIKATSTHTNTIIDQCRIAKENALYYGKNYSFKNTIVDYFLINNTSSNMAYFTNCLLRRYRYYNKTSSSTTNYLYDIYAVFKNCLIGSYYYDYTKTNETSSNYSGGHYLVVDAPSSSEFYNNVFFYDSSNNLTLKSIPTGFNCTGNIIAIYNDLFNTSNQFYEEGYIKTTLTGDDGKQVGPYGGSGFSMIPSIPRITESTIDSYTNAEGKINVKIKVENNK